ncbi:2-oxoglutarate and iron-dependent oxygenase domain-containing protein [Candidatus Poriferisodalis sp.]|uniref:2-oxoglutarate and iron-dependent oxygenase domain-containing protein n=1 Tax=Candidatus Poriferisodalis sp. TaxID=3101277 RepID=UPI003D0FD3FB
MSDGATTGRDDSAVLPVLDISRDTDPVAAASLGAELDDACRGIGFFAVTGHDVVGSLLDEMLAASRRFFALPLADKRRIAIERPRHHRGYAGIEGELLQPGLKADLKETLDFGVERSPTTRNCHRSRDRTSGPTSPVSASLSSDIRLPCCTPRSASCGWLTPRWLSGDFFDERLRRPLVGTRLIR